MVQGSSNLYPASAESRLLRKGEGRGSGKKASGVGVGVGEEKAAAAANPRRRQRARQQNKKKKPKSLSARLLDGVAACPWPLSTEYAETGKYNRLVSAPFPPGDDTDDAVGRDIGRTFPEHPQVCVCV